MGKTRAKALATSFSFFTTAILMSAQGTTSLRGTISDPQKGAVPSASVMLLQQDKGITRSVVSQKNGEYQFVQIPPGSYTLTITAVGFGRDQRREHSTLSGYAGHRGCQSGSGFE